MIRRLAVLLMLAAGPAVAGDTPSATHWVGSWASSQMAMGERDGLPPALLEDATLRQVVRLSIGGHRVRVLLSNAFGTQPLVVDAAHLALAPAADAARITPASDQTLSFDGSGSVTIPPGASYWSDPLAFDAAPGATVAVTLHLPHSPVGETGHPGSHAVSYVLPGSHAGDADLPGARPVEHWFNLAGIAVEAPAKAGAIVALGDSITDGHGSTTNGNDRWPDQLADRLAGPIGLLNQGIGGNRVVNDGYGPNALARFDRDVLAQPGARWVVVLEGINDLGTLTRDAPATPEAHRALVARLIGAYRQIVARAHDAGLKAYGATILPDSGSAYYHPDAASEADRQAVNDWIRAPGHFDAVIDFDAAMRDPADPGRMRKDYDSGDGLHPSPAGYKAMAAAVPASLFR